jgi:hypothetical protein
VPRTGDNSDRSELAKLEYDHLFVDIKDLRLAFEQFRRDTAIGFVSHDILNLHMINMQAQMETLEQNFSDLREDIRRSEQKSIASIMVLELAGACPNTIMRSTMCFKQPLAIPFSVDITISSPALPFPVCRQPIQLFAPREHRPQ